MVAATARAALRARDRDTLKVAAVGHLFRGRPAAELDELGRAYVPTLVDLLRPEMVDRVRWHRTQGHAIVIVSASLGAYLRPLADRLELDAALAVELVVGADGVLTGAVVGDLNTRGPEKVARLRAWTGAAVRRRRAVRAVGLRRFVGRRGAARAGRPPDVGGPPGRRTADGPA